MASLCSLLPNLYHPHLLLPIPSHPCSFLRFGFSTRRSDPFILRGDSTAIVRVFPLSQLPDLGRAEEIAGELIGRVEGIVYTVAGAALSSPDFAAQPTKHNEDWLSGITGAMEKILKVLKDLFSILHVPYSYGFAIILLTVLVKAVTFPLTKRQVESALAMRSLQPQVKAIQQRYAGDQERIQLETARLYKVAGINPLAGCLPTLATIPVWIGLYRALSNVADEGLLTEGFFWIPSLAGPTTIAARQSGSGTSWLFPFVDGHPPLGLSDTLSYLVLPVLLVITQYISVQIMQPPQTDDSSQKNSQAVTKLLPLMIGYFSLSVPSGLSLYWLTNNILSMAQQVWLQKLGGAKNPIKVDVDKIFEDIANNNQKSVFDSEPEKPKLSSKVADKSGFNSEPEKSVLSGEGSDSSGLRRGERFKQIKEEEARRKIQREEDQRRSQKATTVSGTSDDEANVVDEVVAEKKDQINGDGKAALETNHSLPVAGNCSPNSNRASNMVDDGSPHDDTHMS